MRQFNAPVLLNEPIAPNWMHLAFEWPPGLSDPTPGQFFTVLPALVETGAGSILRRPLAFAGFEPAERKTRASAATGSAFAHSIYQVRGPGTRALALQKPGSLIDVIASLGNSFPSPQQGQRPIIAGGGIGIGPLLFLADSLSRAQTAPEDAGYRLVLGFRSASLIPLRAGSLDGSPMASLWKELLSRAFFATDDGSEGFRGTVVDALASLKSEESSGRAWHLYGCGPGPMLASLAKFVGAHHIDAHCSAEQWMACGVGACQGCVLPSTSGDFLRVCADGPVFEAGQIDWEASLK
jgi:dihydroorotate dehydrogenase electron transfer subunit